MPGPTVLNLLLGDMLFPSWGLPEGPVFMAEDWGLCTETRHHQQKLVLFLSAMRHTRNRFRAEGREVVYFELDPSDRTSWIDRLTVQAQRRNAQVHTYRIADRRPRQMLREALEAQGIHLTEHPNPAFLTPPDVWDSFAKSGRRLLMANFYQQQRRRLGLLIDDDGSPTGGQWSFDEANRKPLPRSVTPQNVWKVNPDALTLQVIDQVEKTFPDHPGAARDFAYAVTPSDAAVWLDQFLEERLDAFGDYEDALSTRTATVFHSLLSPYLNCGLLTPGQVISATMARHRARPVPLNSLEGFLRQVIGWREFIYGIDQEYGHRGISASDNPLGHRRQLAPAWWTGETGLPPLDLAIRRTLDHAWCHHIERLMVIGAAMLMCEVDPQEAYRWFLEMFLDSADWVMAPNVLGMSQFSDGGLFATKPYLSGSAYLRKMGDYEPGPWCDVWDGLYWRFIDRHRSLFAQNPRMSVVVKSLDRLDPVRKERIFTAAERFIDRVTYEGV